jgi:Prp8 binding protein
MEVIKRPGSPTSTALQVSKRSRPDAGTLIVREGPKRTSSLHAPIMLLTGHQGAVLSFKFDPSGQNCASSSVDKTVPPRSPAAGACVAMTPCRFCCGAWLAPTTTTAYCAVTSRRVHRTNCTRMHAVTLFQAVLQLNWTSGGDNIWTASADKSVGFWDAVTGQRVRKMPDHSNIVNAGLHARFVAASSPVRLPH